MRKNGYSTLAMLLTVGSIALTWMTGEAAAGITARLTPCPSNPRYFASDGQPVVILGEGSPLAAHKTDDYRAYIDDMAAHKVNYGRIWPMLVWTARDVYFPWARDGAGTAKDGLPKFDLTHWDTNFWNRLNDACAYAQSKGVYLSIIVFEECGMEAPASSTNHRWDWHPFNPSNNVNGLSLPTSGDCVPEFYDLSYSKLKSLQESYVSKLIGETSRYPNVIYEICNEYTGPWDWEKYWIDFISARCSNIVSVSGGSVPSTYWTDPNIDIVNFHWGTTSAGTTNSNMVSYYSKKKPVCYDETPEFSGVTYTDYRKMLWAAFVGGGHIHLESWYNNAAAKDTVLHAVNFIRTNGIRFWEMAPNNSLVTSTPGGSAYTLAKPGSQYVIYIVGSGGGSMKVNLATGLSYTAKAYNPSTGAYTNLSVDGGTISGIPSYSSDIAVYVEALGPSEPGGGLTINGLKANADTVGMYELYELTFSLAGVSPSNFNPFRPETTGDSLSPAGVGVRAEIVTPSGDVRTVCGFFDVDYAYLGNMTDSQYSKRDRMVPTLGPHWHARYAPGELGTYKVTVKATDASGTAVSQPLTLTCVESETHGFVRVADDGVRFAYSDGTPFVPFGMMAPYGTGYVAPTVASMRANRMNFLRRWLVDRDMDDIFRDLEGWSSSYTYDTAVFRSGGRSVKKTVTGSGTLVDQSFIGCKPNTYYKAFAYLKTSSSFNGRVAVGVVEHRADGSKTTWTGTEIGGGKDWAYSQIVFKTSSTAEVLHFKPRIVSGSAGAVWIDDVGLYECDSSGNTVVDWNMVFAPGFEQWTPAELRLVPLARFEYLLQMCEANDIVVQPAIFNYRLWNKSDPTGFYARFFGDWWTDPASVAQQERALRYLVARFGHYRSLFAWELTNEMDASYTDVRGNWIAGRANFIRAHDPYDHLITNSLWSSPGDYRYAQMGELDLNQVHYYINTEERTTGQGVPSWWDISGGMVLDGNPANAASGVKSLKAAANGGTISESATVYCKPGKSYTLRYKVKTSGVTGQASVIIRFFGGTSAGSTVTLDNTGTSGYTSRTHTFTTGSTAEGFTVNLQLTGGAGTAWWDDVEIIDDATGLNVLYNGGFESPPFGDDEFEWAVYNTIRSRERYGAGRNGADKPWASGEFGLMGANADLSYWARYGDTTKPRHDSTGIHVHNCIWAQLMVGSALNTPTYWWVTEYILPYNLYGVWKGATSFAAALPFYDRGRTVSTDSSAEVRASSSHPRIRLLGQKKATSGYFWIQNSENTWSRVVREGLKPTPTDASLTVPGFEDGGYVVNWYDTYTGAFVRTESKLVSGGLLALSVSSLSTDTAAIVSKQNPSSKQPSVSLVLSVDKAVALPSEAITYTVDYMNKGDGDAMNVEITLPIPANTTFVPGSASDAGVYDPAANCVRWIVPLLASGESGRCLAKVRVQ